MEYKKKESEIENIAGKMEATDFVDARENDRCRYLGKFLEEVRGIARGYLYEQH